MLSQQNKKIFIQCLIQRSRYIFEFFNKILSLPAYQIFTRITFYKIDSLIIIQF